MSDSNATIIVGIRDSMPDVLAALRRSLNTSVALAIPDESALFLTASEFQSLQAVAAQMHIAVTVLTDDPLRRQLATIFKLNVASALRPPELTDAESAPSLIGPPAPPQPEPEPEPEPEPVAEPLQAELVPTPPPSDEPPANVSTLAPIDETVTTTQEPVSIEPTLTEFTATTPPPAPIVASDQATPVTTDAMPPAPREDDASPSQHRRTSRRQRLVAVAAVVVVAGLAYLGAFLFLTRATIVLSMSRQAIDQTVAVAVLAPGQTAPASGASIAASPVTFAVSTTQTGNATGVQTVGDAPARGTILLSNPTEQAVSIPAGTRLDDKLTGTAYQFVAAVDVVAGQGDIPGFGQAEIICLEPGTVGNREIGFLSGELENGVYYSNREAAIAGGTDRQTTIVTQADLDALQATALDAMTTDAGNYAPGVDQAIIANSVQIANPAFTPNVQPGQESATITLQATGEATALAYSAAERDAAVRAAISVPAGFTVDPNGLALAPPESTSNGDLSMLTVRATGIAVAALTAEQRDRIATSLADDGEGAVRDYLDSLGNVDAAEIHYRPAWLPKRAPSSSDRISVETR